MPDRDILAIKAGRRFGRVARPWVNQGPSDAVVRIVGKALSAAARDGDPVLAACHREQARASEADDTHAWERALWALALRRLIAPTRSARLRRLDFDAENREVESLRAGLAPDIRRLAVQLTDGRKPRASSRALPDLATVLGREVPIQL